MKTNNFFEEIEFFYNKFLINKHVLIPRIETESLVRECIKIIKIDNINTVIDMGTGSGIIAISIYLNSDINNIFAVDISKRALKIAKLNAEKFKAPVNFIQSDLLKHFIQGDYNFTENILIVANLPYIKDNDWQNMSDDTKFEPKKSLFGGRNTGFELYEKLILQGLRLKKIHKVNKLFLLCEIGFDQKNIAINYLNKLGLKYNFFKDLRKIDRILQIIY